MDDSDDVRRVTESVVSRVRVRLYESIDGLSDCKFEVKDDRLFLLVRLLLVDEKCNKESVSAALEIASFILKELIPRREDDYSWMVSVECKGRPFDSQMGGWNRATIPLYFRASAVIPRFGGCSFAEAVAMSYRICKMINLGLAALIVQT